MSFDNRFTATVEVNADAQIVITLSEVRGPACTHVLMPVVISRELSLALAEAILVQRKSER